MRICFSGAQSVGKTSLVNAFQQVWPKYKVVQTTYRDIVKEKNLPLNKAGTIESQRIIRDALAEQAIQNAAEKYALHDRSILDNIAYSIYLDDKGKIDDADFMYDSITMCREIMKLYDVIFWLPLDPTYIIPQREGRDHDPVYREEIDNIFAGMHQHYITNTGILFDKEDQPPMIPLYGKTTEARIEEIKMYLDQDGELIVTETSVFDELGKGDIDMDEMKSAFEQQNFLDEVKQG